MSGLTKGLRKGLVGAALLVSLGAAWNASTSPAPLQANAMRPRPFDGTLSVLTYNVEGLPWPVGWNRTTRLERIGERLAAMHRAGTAPGIVVMQEVFSPAAQAIGRGAGYPYVVDGLGRDRLDGTEAPSSAQAFARDADWAKGETEGKYVGSGLQILSDYPVIAVHRMAFPAYACAGYDCLANKGALLVTLAIPGSGSGAPMPVDVLTTHLNSKRASGVSDDRSLAAFAMQVAALSDFVRRHHDPARPLIAAGDYNVGKSAPRRAALLNAVGRDWIPGQTIRDALRTGAQQGIALPPDAQLTLVHAKDWQFFASAGNALEVGGFEVPFGRDGDGAMLSDHVGYVTRFRLKCTENIALAGGAEAARATGPAKSST